MPPVFYRHLICSLKKKKAALKRYIADCSSTALLHIQNLCLTNILIKYCNELNKVEMLRWTVDNMRICTCIQQEVKVPFQYYVKKRSHPSIRGLDQQFTLQTFLLNEKNPPSPPLPAPWWSEDLLAKWSVQFEVCYQISVFIDIHFGDDFHIHRQL